MHFEPRDIKFMPQHPETLNIIEDKLNNKRNKKTMQEELQSTVSSMHHEQKLMPLKDNNRNHTQLYMR